MIKEVFITDKYGKIIYGNVKKYPEIEEYPLSINNGTKLSQLKVNDCILSILYTNMDNFIAAKTLLNIKKYLDSKELLINSNFVTRNYFLFIKALYYPNSIFDINNNKMILKTDNIYLDVIEQYQTIIRDNKVIKNNLYGEIVYRDDREIKTEIKLDGSVDIYRTTHKIDLDANANGLKALNVYYKTGNKTLVSYHKDNLDEPLILFNKSGNFYKFSCKNQVKFKVLRIMIPVQESTYDAQIDVKHGTVDLDLENNYVVWTLTGHKLLEDTIYFVPKVLGHKTDTRSIKINFTLENYKNTLAKVTKSEVVFNQEARVWVKYFTQASHYEIRF